MNELDHMPSAAFVIPYSDQVITIDLTNRQTALRVDESRLREAVRVILEEASIFEAEVSVAVVDDPTIHELNRRYLRHDEPTDVLSFLLERSDEGLEGEIVVSAETATRTAPRYDWSAHDELLLYVIHGTLHLLGHDDQTSPERAAMQDRERAYLARFGLQPRYEEHETPDPHAGNADPSARPTPGGSEVP